ncbi:hypothetical protein DICVIV_04544 [Dictyocaulus viviparus]|uniref:Uncharacterized protein n=1 Tax=Dictyocaulus viviparus TaxID=29172 RepID=A0A0D8Y454_DICVI|nr:hypothetical protein DICVIV_04544 [Dictyocaulus viviparus]
MQEGNRASRGYAWSGPTYNTDVLTSTARPSRVFELWVKKHYMVESSHIDLLSDIEVTKRPTAEHSAPELQTIYKKAKK